MGIEVNIPWMTYEEIRARADSFLRRYHPSIEIPIPVEDIVELQLDLNIIPLPGLQQAYDVVGFPYGDKSAIAVDHFVQEYRENRYRFTLAHEVGHLELHPQLFEARRVTNIVEWKAFINDIPDDIYSRAEWQAYSFAGLILVPADPLAEAVKEQIRVIKESGSGRATTPDFLWDLIERGVAKKFVVSKDVIHKRIEADSLRTKFDPQAV